MGLGKRELVAVGAVLGVLIGPCGFRPGILGRQQRGMYLVTRVGQVFQFLDGLVVVDLGRAKCLLVIQAGLVGVGQAGILVEIRLSIIQVRFARSNVRLGIVDAGLDGTLVELIPGQLGGRAGLLGIHIGLPGLGACQAGGPIEGVESLLDGGQGQLCRGQGSLGRLAVGQAGQYLSLLDLVALPDRDLGHFAICLESQVLVTARGEMPFGNHRICRCDRCRRGGITRAAAACRQHQSQHQDDGE